MPVVLEERWSSRAGAVDENSTRTNQDLEYIATGSDDDADIKAAAVASLPATYAGQTLQNFRLERLAELIWLVVAHYGNKDVRQAGDGTFSFDTSGATQHITQALESVGFSGIAGAPDLKGAINVTKDAVEGVDIVVPQYAWNESFIFNNALVDGAYKATLFALTGTTNLAGFRGFAAGEVLFKGARGTKRNKLEWDIAFDFAASPNVAGLSITGLPAFADTKGGWDYVSVNYIDAEDDDTLIKTPSFARILRVYEKGDFSGLGIGS